MGRMPSSVVIFSLFVLLGCEKSSVPSSPAKTTEAEPAAKSTAAISANKGAPSTQKPAKPRVSDSKRSPECLAALDSVKKLKASASANPDEIKKAVSEAMSVCAKAHPSVSKRGAEPAKPIEPAVAKGPAPDGLSGRWIIDPNGIDQLPEFQKLPEAQRAMAMQMFKNLKMEITFGANEIATNGTFMGQPRAEKTAFKIMKRDGNVLTIETTKGDKVASQILTVEGDTLRIKDVVKNNTLVLKRAK